MNGMSFRITVHAGTKVEQLLATVRERAVVRASELDARGLRGLVVGAGAVQHIPSLEGGSSYVVALFRSRCSKVM